MEPVTQLSDMMRSFFDCDTIPPEPNIFSPGFLPDRTNKYEFNCHILCEKLLLCKNCVRKLKFATIIELKTQFHALPPAKMRPRSKQTEKFPI